MHGAQPATTHETRKGTYQKAQLWPLREEVSIREDGVGFRQVSILQRLQSQETSEEAHAWRKQQSVKSRRCKKKGPGVPLGKTQTNPIRKRPAQSTTTYNELLYERKLSLILVPEAGRSRQSASRQPRTTREEQHDRPSQQLMAPNQPGAEASQRACQHRKHTKEAGRATQQGREGRTSTRDVLYQSNGCRAPPWSGRRGGSTHIRCTSDRH